MERNERRMSAISYLGVLLNLLTLIGGLICAIFIYFLEGEPVKRHAKRAIISQLIPFGLLLIAVITNPGVLSLISDRVLDILGGAGYLIAYGFFVLLIFISFIVSFIWNLYQGIKVIRGKHETERPHFV
ncbi:DUF4870 domain-containing protein [Bacillus sp. BGMRC 2118]|nr:DUF4870 domain-containing protein [Bacillus sp. BGMRC 2118]